MDGDRVYTAADLKVLSFEELVRKHTGMYFAVAPSSPDLPTNIVRRVLGDALHSEGDASHHNVDIEIAGDLRFTVTDDQPPISDDASEPKSGFFGSMIARPRWALASGGSDGTRVTFQLDADFIAPGAAISTEIHQLLPRFESCPTCAGASWADTLRVRDLRLSAL